VTLALALSTLALLAYTYVGYPIVIGALARLWPARAAGADAAAAPFVSVCLPVYDGAQFLPAKLASLLAQDHPAERLEILIYCDGCADESEAMARAFAAEAGGRVRVFASSERRGKPVALNTLVPEARGDVLLLNDARQPLSKNAASALAAALRDPNVGCATGRLVLAGGAASGVYWRYEDWIRRQESAFRGVVGMTGALAMMRRADWEPVPDDLILDDVWIPTRLGLRRKRVRLVTEAEAYDTAFEDDGEFRRKVRTLAGNFQLLSYMPALLDPAANPTFFELVSHKVMRLVAPWLLVLLMIVTLVGAVGAGGAAWLMRALLAAQAAFYAAALAGARAGRLASVARTFVVLNAAAIVGLYKHVSGRQRVTW